MWKKTGSKTYTCLSTDVKLKTMGLDPVDPESRLIEVQPDGSLLGYLFIQGDWRLVGQVAGLSDSIIHINSGAILPVLSDVDVSDIATTTAKVNFKANVPGTYYYLVYAAGDGAPDATTIMAQGAAVAKDTAITLGGEVTSSDITGLTANTDYLLYLVFQSVEGALTDIETLEIDTLSE